MEKEIEDQEMEVRKQKIRKLIAIVMAEKLRKTQAHQKEQFKQSDEFMSMFKDQIVETNENTQFKMSTSPRG